MSPASLSEQVFVFADGRRENRFVFVDNRDPATFIALDKKQFRRFEFSNGELDVWKREWVEYHEWNEDRQGRPDCKECGGTGTVKRRVSGGATQSACDCRSRL